LYLPSTNGDSRDLGGLARPDGIISWLAKTGMVQHISGIRTDLQLHATLRPDIERLSE
jgi:hypothetical protein